jgi:hypothetical protein
MNKSFILSLGIFILVILLCLQCTKSVKMNNLKQEIHDLDFHTSHSQFFLTTDDQTSIDNLAYIEVKDAEFQNRLGVYENLLVVHTESYGHIKGRLRISNQPTILDYPNIDHVVEGSIKVIESKIEITDCPFGTQILFLTIPNGIYRVRISSCNLASVSGDNGEDFYYIDIWPAPADDLVVLKQYKNE